MRPAHALVLSLAAASALAPLPALAATRARDLGVPFDGVPGPENAITDVAGVEVGHSTIIRGEGPLKVGEGPVRTGVTVIFPLGKTATDGVTAGYYVLNGTGEMTGAILLDEHGVLFGPVAITNTLSVGAVMEAVVRWSMRHVSNEVDLYARTQPTVAETWDGGLNDIYGFHVKPEHVFAALDGAASGPVAEGNVGGGTGMVCYEFKGGIGTASRVPSAKDGGYTLGVLVQANFGLRHQLRIAGIPIGTEIREGLVRSEDSGSIIIVVATDAPLLPHQAKRLARRAALGLARTGSVAGNGSGDLFLAFSTANAAAGDAEGVVPLSMLPNDRMGPLFEATVGATEEAFVNALVAARTMTGHDGRTVVALPHDTLRAILERHGRLNR